MVRAVPPSPRASCSTRGVAARENITIGLNYSFQFKVGL